MAVHESIAGEDRHLTPADAAKVINSGNGTAIQRRAAAIRFLRDLEWIKEGGSYAFVRETEDMQPHLDEAARIRNDCPGAIQGTAGLRHVGNVPYIVAQEYFNQTGCDPFESDEAMTKFLNDSNFSKFRTGKM